MLKMNEKVPAFYEITLKEAFFPLQVLPWDKRLNKSISKKVLIKING